MKTLLQITSFATITMFAMTASANHIDSIQDDSVTGNGVTNATFSLTTTGPAVMDTQVGEPADILGGTRVVTLFDDRLLLPGGSAEKAAGTDYIQLTATGLQTPTLTLDYPDISDANFASMWNSIGVTFLLLDSPLSPGAVAADLTVAVESSAGNGSVTMDLVQAAGESSVFFPFNSPGFAGVDFGDIDGVTVTIDPRIVAFSYQLGEITREQIVPEPTSIALVMTGLASLAGVFIVRRRQKS